MRRQSTWKHRTFGAALVTMLVVGAIWEVRRARAFNPQPDPPGRYTMVGIVRGQRIRINASNINPTDPNLPPDPCRVRLAFMDADGNVLVNPRTGEAVGKTVTLQNGQSAFLHVNADEFFTGDSAPGRLELRPVFRSVTLNSDAQPPPLRCVPSLKSSTTPRPRPRSCTRARRRSAIRPTQIARSRLCESHKETGYERR